MFAEHLSAGHRVPVWVAGPAPAFGGQCDELALNPGGLAPKFSALQVIFLFVEQENVLIRALICGPKAQFGLRDLFPRAHILL
jgi:hypothetical protein